MNDKRYQWILYSITGVIVITIGIQVFWNYKNYEANEQRLIMDVQVSLDKAVDDYYTQLAQQTTLGMSFDDMSTDEIIDDNSSFNKVLKNIDLKNGKFKNLDSIDVSEIKGATMVRGFAVDSMMEAHNRKNKPISVDSLKNQIETLKATKKDLDLSNIKMLTSKIVISIKNDTLNVSELDSILNRELLRKNITLESELVYHKNHKSHISDKGIDSIPPERLLSLGKNILNINSRSSLLPKNSRLQLYFTNTTRTILKRSLVGILISTLLVAAVISCLFYLLRVIKNQKQLAEVKNDLISNITHEFKTPISTIGVALESISNFNGIEDKEKTRKYISMSSEQLEKLNIMVEKLLETATLNSDNLELSKEPLDVVRLLDELVTRYAMRFQDKQFNVEIELTSHLAKVDVFHFENALNNILDNAVKYGGPCITVRLSTKINTFEIGISDNGHTLTKAHKERIFEQFYRVPKGNRHDVKGFGIGLFYTKTIIEKHDGTIKLNLDKDLTTFKITLPNG